MVCPSCDVETVDRLPGPEPTPDVDLVCAFATGDPGLVAVAKSLLDGDDVDYFVRGEDLQNMFGLPLGGPTEFWVREEDAARVRDLLEDLAPSGERDQP